MNDKQKEALLILQEECAEVIQAACKISRFGVESRWHHRLPIERKAEA